MFPSTPLIDSLRSQGFDIDVQYYADVILEGAFPTLLSEIVGTLSNFRIDIEELIRGGGGEAPHIQRLGNTLSAMGWVEHEFRITTHIDEREVVSQTHKIDHIKSWNDTTIGLEIEWNNKDPFFNRDLETFSRLHADDVISVGIIVTRGKSLNDGLGPTILGWANKSGISSISDLAPYDYTPTVRQQTTINQRTARGQSFAEAWTGLFISDKYGAATTHWDKLRTRLLQGVGAPCPILSIGLPLSCIVTP